MIRRWIDRDWSALAERGVLALVLGIAALISYTHLREVWVTSGAPWQALGPLLVDGLFASAWLRMRRRRRDGIAVGWLAWLALGLALVGTLAGNLAAAWVTGHRDPLALVVAAVPAIAFALVWELVTGHDRGRQPTARTVADLVAEREAESPSIPPTPPITEDSGPGESPTRVTLHLAPAPSTPGDDVETGTVERVAGIVAEGGGRRTVMKELGVSEYEARKLLERARA